MFVLVEKVFLILRAGGFTYHKRLALCHNVSKWIQFIVCICLVLVFRFKEQWSLKERISLYSLQVPMNCYTRSVNKLVKIRKCLEHLSHMLISSSEFFSIDLNSTKLLSLHLTANSLFSFSWGCVLCHDIGNHNEPFWSLVIKIM